MYSATNIPSYHPWVKNQTVYNPRPATQKKGRQWGRVSLLSHILAIEIASVWTYDSGANVRTLAPAAVANAPTCMSTPVSRGDSWRSVSCACVRSHASRSAPALVSRACRLYPSALTRMNAGLAAASMWLWQVGGVRTDSIAS
jgi:hypothetical protein